MSDYKMPIHVSKKKKLIITYAWKLIVKKRFVRKKFDYYIATLHALCLDGKCLFMLVRLLIRIRNRLRII